MLEIYSSTPYSYEGKPELTKPGGACEAYWLALGTTTVTTVSVVKLVKEFINANGYWLFIHNLEYTEDVTRSNKFYHYSWQVRKQQLERLVPGSSFSTTRIAIPTVTLILLREDFLLSTTTTSNLSKDRYRFGLISFDNPSRPPMVFSDPIEGLDSALDSAYAMLMASCSGTTTASQSQIFDTNGVRFPPQLILSKEDRLTNHILQISGELGLRMEEFSLNIN